MSNLFSYKGRINRSKYLLFLFGLSIISFTVSVILEMGDNIAVTIIAIILSIVLSVKTICVEIERLHDIERPGIHVLLLLIPFYNIYLKLVLLFKKGTEGSNEYGKDPLEV